MRQVYTVIDKLKTKLKQNGLTNTVTFGQNNYLSIIPHING